MIYLGNPCGPAVIDAMAAGSLGLIDTPYQGKVKAVAAAHAGGAVWCADNGAFTDKWDAGTWWSWLLEQTPHVATCLFATAPDVVGDAAATLARSLPWMPKMRALGFPVAFVAQNGWDTIDVPWDLFDVLFVGGDDDFKLGPAGRVAVAQAKARGKRVHMGRVNSEKRWRYAHAIGCDSVDGTYLTFGHPRLLRDVIAWSRGTAHQAALFD